MRVLREPLVHFLLIGIGLFGLYSLIQPAVDDDLNRIVITSSQKDQIEAQFSRTWMRPPTEDEYNALIKSYVRDEVYYREAIALGLDKDDMQIRQRMRQKLDFILEDLVVEEVNDKTLLLFLQQHPDKFSQQTQTSFEQLYLNPDKHQDLAADAAIILQNLRDGAIPQTLTDPTMLPYAYRLLTPSEIARQLGDKFALEVQALVPDEWAGPIYSGLGGHLVKITEQIPSSLPELAEVRSEVEREYHTQRRQQKKDIAYQKMLEGYEVVIEQTTEGKSANKSVASLKVKDARK
jgi:hypothetical protein